MRLKSWNGLCMVRAMAEGSSSTFSCRPLPALTALALAASLSAHGGQYRGPGEVVPPSSSSSRSAGSAGAGTGSGSGSPAGASGTATGSSAGGAARTSAAASGGPLPRGVPLDDDLTRWEFWWEFRKDPYLRLRNSLYRPRAATNPDPLAWRTHHGPLQPPTDQDRAKIAVPALLEALSRSEDRDTITGCLVALAKIGIDGRKARLHDLFVERLSSHDQEVRETAALCLGIRGQQDLAARTVLMDLLGDSARGRVCCDKGEVDERTRAFAAYGLGLLLPGMDAASSSSVVRALLVPLQAPAGRLRNLKVSCIAAISQVSHADTSAMRAVREVASIGIERYYERDLGPGEELVQAHCPPAIAGLLGADHPRTAHTRDRLVADLAGSLGRRTEGRRVRVNHHIAQSCALALGHLLGPWDAEDSPDAAGAELLLETWRNHKDGQTRNFALLDLGQVGGKLATQTLLDELDRGGKAVEKPWAAAGLATLLVEERRRSTAAGRSYQADPRVGKVLLDALRSVKNPSSQGAFAIALGLGGYRDAADELCALLRANRSKDELAGQVAVALALLDHDRARVDLRELLTQSVRRPALLVQVATSLGRLGDQEVVGRLVELLQDESGGLARLSAIAGALGQLGDRRSLPALVDVLENAELTALTRAFAAVAIGSVCDKQSLPWNAAYGASLNYRAAVETLTDGAAGILDIL